ncbi:Zinc finger, U1-C type [Akanthomyces lecanii RCEF 1005]|uniref:Zinc finger, U1-C type n=1 Tax=Akanthomyces lecanii RCEF 1005 TaxID=1081108 RepID=A0A168JR21_CORDF|nr:Zinc finger, U1-C type [Akanthomyces lecanii RCEF 1005]
MSEYWKSTPRYWCKYCAVYVRDTKIERANHESTGKHQGAVKRSLRDLHRSHDRDERDKERAKREIDRLNGVVPSGSSHTSGGAGSSSSHQPASGSSRPAPPPVTSEASLKRQREQLAELGVAVPSSFRPEMAMPGEWTVTNTRVIETRPSGDEAKVEARASGVRKREENEEEKEQEEAMRGLFKKPKRWGRLDSRAMPEDQEAELDALLSGSLVKKQSADDGVAKGEGVKEESKADDGADVKLEPAVKEEEPDTAAGGITETAAKSEDADPTVGAIVFKKRKPKGLRTK